MVKAVLFANVASGRGQKWLFKVIQAAPDAGVDIVSTCFDISPQGIESGLQLAAKEGVPTILAMGGDGTVGSVANHLLGGDWTLGVLPSGTSNDFARSVGLPLDPAGALRTVGTGHTAQLDVGVVNGHAFLHAAAVGLNTQFAREAGKLRTFLGRLSYPVAAIKVFRDPRPFCARIEAGGTEQEYRALDVIVLNSPIFGGALELEAASLGLQDGTASMLIVERLNLMTLVRALPLIVERRILRFPGLEVLATSSLRLTTEPPQQITVDGETGDWTPVNIEVRRRALRVLVPAQFASRNDEPAE